MDVPPEEYAGCPTGIPKHTKANGDLSDGLRAVEFSLSGPRQFRQRRLRALISAEREVPGWMPLEFLEA